MRALRAQKWPPQKRGLKSCANGLRGVRGQDRAQRTKLFACQGRLLVGDDPLLGGEFAVLAGGTVPSLAWPDSMGGLHLVGGEEAFSAAAGSPP